MNIPALTDEQAQRAIFIFFEQIPEALLPEKKPKLVEIEMMAEEASDNADGKEADLLNALEDHNPALRGEVSRKLLEILAANDSLKPHVQAAVEEASQPKMVPVPLIIAATIVVCFGIAALSKEKSMEYTTNADGSQNRKETSKSAIHNIPEILKGAADVVDKLPNFKDLMGK